MSSKRFPGKVLAPFRGRPVLWHMVDRVAGAVPRRDIVLATSSDASDDPLAAYAAELGLAVFRGERDDVFARFQACLKAHPCGWLLRICADSPLLDPGVVTAMLGYAGRRDVDIVTNVFPRTFPKGQSAELLESGTFRALASESLTASEREHVTLFYYNNPKRFRIANVASGNPALARRHLDIAAPGDLARLEAEYPDDSKLPRFPAPAPVRP